MILAWVNSIYEALDAFCVGMRTTAAFFVENLRGRGGGMTVTRQYPQEPAVVVGDRTRGHLFNVAPECIVCFACDKVCPVDCFVMEMERDPDNKPRASRFDIDISKCIYCGLCVTACPTDSLSMTPAFELNPHHDGKRFLFNRSSDQLEQRLEEPDVVRMTKLANTPRAQLSAEDRVWLDGIINPQGHHLIGMFGMGYYTAEEKVKVDAEIAAKKKAKEAAAAAAKAAKAAAAPAAPAAPAPAPAPKPPGASA